MRTSRNRYCCHVSAALLLFVLFPLIVHPFVFDARQSQSQSSQSTTGFSYLPLCPGSFVSADPLWVPDRDNNGGTAGSTNEKNVCNRSDDASATTTNTSTKDFILDLDLAIATIKPQKRKGWIEAIQKCPDLAEQSKWWFLQSEEFDITRAANKLIKYWDMRIQLFGKEKAFLPMTLDGAVQDDIAALEQGVWRLAGKDRYGRTIVFADPARHDNGKCSLESLARANWYIIHKALEDEETQKKGVVFVNHPANLRLRQLNPRLAKISMGSECLPIRIRGFHIINPPAFFTNVAFPIIRALIGSQHRDMLVVHSADSYDDIIAELETYGIPKEAMPVEIGGDADI